MRAPLSPSPVPHVCCSGFLSLPSPFSSLHPPSPRAMGLPGLYCPWLQSAHGARNGTRASRAWDPGPWAGPQDGRGATGAQQPTSSPPCLLPTLPTLTPLAVQLRWGLSTSRAGGWAAVLGLCLKPRGSLLLPPPALPEPGPCAACPPCPFVPKAGARQAEAEGPPCQRLGISLNPHSAGTSSLSLRQHI